LDSFLEKLGDAGKLERPPTMEGKKMTALIMPSKVKPKPKPNPTEKHDILARGKLSPPES
jgi:hypothetical protein